MTVEELLGRGAIVMKNESCLLGTSKSGNSNNRMIFNFPNLTELHEGSNFLFGTTYWHNDYLHVGHVHYDIALIQVLQSTKVDRIIIQRSVCHGILCHGLGVLDSYYKGFYAAVLDAAEQYNVPVYLRWYNEKYWSPYYFSTNFKQKYKTYIEEFDKKMLEPISVQNTMCFSRVIHRSNLKYGAIGTVSSNAVHKFKASAYKMVYDSTDNEEVLKTFFRKNQGEKPFIILVSHRGQHASRHMQNIDDLIYYLRKRFQQPKYLVKQFNNSLSTNDYRMQIQAVAEAHVVITNHGVSFVK